MTIEALYQELKTLSPDQLASVYSFVYLLKNPEFLPVSTERKISIEPFTNEKEALDFVNYYSERLLNETR